MIENKIAAFPYEIKNPTTGHEISYGLTKREYMATHLLSGMLSVEEATRNLGPELVVKAAVRLTDMLLKELAK